MVFELVGQTRSVLVALSLNVKNRGGPRYHSLRLTEPNLGSNRLMERIFPDGCAVWMRCSRTAARNTTAHAARAPPPPTAAAAAA